MREPDCEPCAAGYYAEAVEHTCDPDRDALFPQYGDAVCAVCKSPTWRPVAEAEKVCTRASCQQIKAFRDRYVAAHEGTA